jgi:predicted transcriptional regulator YdeE
MIAKIMKSAKSFQAVYYNEHKVSEQKAQLLSAANFPIVETRWDKNQYIAYLTKVSALNPNVKSRQFHAVISTKGTAHDAATLKIIADAYLAKMGYDKNPYLLYFHQDTDNNHIHIVSTRVNTEGVKVNDSFEKKRSLGHIEAIMNQIEQTVKNENPIKDRLNEYQFSTESQMHLLAQSFGYEIVKDKEGNTRLEKDNITFAVLTHEDIEQQISNTKKEINGSQKDKRKQQLKAILLKYSDGKNEAELQKLMHEKFGIELIFHRGIDREGKDKPFGYTLIDHNTKQIFKGSEVLKLSEILKGLNHPNNTVEKKEAITVENNPHKARLKELAKDVQNDPHKISAFNAYLNEHDLFIIERDGKPFLIDEKNDEVFDLSSIKELKDKQHFDFIRMDDTRPFKLVQTNINNVENDLNFEGQEQAQQLGNIAMLLPSSDESESDRKRKVKRGR